MGDVTNLQGTDDGGFLDLNGRQVHAFSMKMANLGYAEMSTQLMAMFRSGAWQRFTTGLGEHVFLPGEFDYFLTQQGVKRDDVIRGVRESELKAELDAAMDERRTGEEGYRRHLNAVRQQVPQRPGRPIEPFGYTKAEVKSLVESTGDTVALEKREALGARTRRLRENKGETSRAPNERQPRWMQLRNSAERLPDDDLDELLTALQAERRRRRKPRRDTAEDPQSTNR